MNFCSECGGKVSRRIPEGDVRERDVCQTCGTIHYQNPKIVAGTLPLYQGRILMCRRAIEPRKGYWTLPAGFMELNETVAEAAIRETREEACALVTLGRMYTIINIPHIGQVHLFYLAEVRDGEFGVGEESLEVRLFAPNEIPWEELAFRSVRLTLERLLEEDQVPEIQKAHSDILELNLTAPPDWPSPSG